MRNKILMTVLIVLLMAGGLVMSGCKASCRSIEPTKNCDCSNGNVYSNPTCGGDINGKCNC